MDANAAMLRDQTETGIVQSVKLVDAGLKLSDDVLNLQMRNGMDLFPAEYERSGRNPDATMDLAGLKEQLGGTMDLYVINESGVIVSTTFEPDLGLDFRRYPDILLAHHGDTTRRRLRRRTGGPESQYRTFEDIQLLQRPDHEGDATGRGDPHVHDQAGVPRQERPRDHECHADQVIRFIFVDMTDPDYASGMSLIVELTCSTGLADAILAKMPASHSVILLFAAHRITRPIRDIASDVDSTAQGNLDQRHPGGWRRGVRAPRAEHQYHGRRHEGEHAETP